MEWQDETPTEDGWYWLRRFIAEKNRTSDSVVEVFDPIYRDVDWKYVRMKHGSRVKTNNNCFDENVKWAGPIPKPTESS